MALTYLQDPMGEEIQNYRHKRKSEYHNTLVDFIKPIEADGIVPSGVVSDRSPVLCPCNVTEHLNLPPPHASTSQFSKLIITKNNIIVCRIIK